MSTTPGPATSAVLSLRSVSKRYGAVQAVREVSVDCYGGEIHALVGENGSGKSTLLGIASGFLAPDEGSVEIGGRPLATASVAEAMRLGLGMAYQTYSQVLAMSVAENLYLAVPPSTRPAYGDMETWAEKKLEEFGLESPRGSARREPIARRPAAARGGESSASGAKGVASGRADDRARARGHRAASHARLRAEQAGSRGDVRQPPATGGARDRRPDHRPSRRGCPGDVRRGRDVGGRTRSADDRTPSRSAFPDRDSDRGPSEICLESSPGSKAIDSDRSTSKYTRARSSASPEPKATDRCQFLAICGRRGAFDRNVSLQRRRDRQADHRSARSGRE